MNVVEIIRSYMGAYSPDAVRSMLGADHDRIRALAAQIGNDEATNRCVRALDGRVDALLERLGQSELAATDALLAHALVLQEILDHIQSVELPTVEGHGAHFPKAGPTPSNTMAVPAPRRVQ